MAQRVGAAQPIADVIQKGINTVTNIFGNSAKGVGKANQMKTIPADNPNRKAWEAAMTFQGPPSKLATRKVTSSTSVSKGAAPTKTGTQKKVITKR